MTQSFDFAGTPKVFFGPGKIKVVPDVITQYGHTLLIVTGGSSFEISDQWGRFLAALDKAGIRHYRISIKGEPSPENIDEATEFFRKKQVDTVMAWGGGSAIDAGKAISAMLPLPEGASVFDFLEGVGSGATHNGDKAPFIAIPTTAGTGSEATKNAVISRVGEKGFKKSLRHDNFVPDVAILDPELALACPSHVTAACGMDAFTQLLEAYVSTKASPLTDALAWSGIKTLIDGLVRTCSNGDSDIEARGKMAYAAFLSGVALANAGLGVVHGLASPIGGRFEIPHGVVCGTLMSEAVSITATKLLARHGPEHPVCMKFSRVGALLAGQHDAGVEEGCKLLIKKLHDLTEALYIPRLGAYGIRDEHLNDIADAASNKNNPIPLEKSEIRELLERRL